MNKYMLLFRSDPGLIKTASPEQIQQTMQKWIDWKASLEQSGHLHQLGERLQQTGKVLRGKSKTLSDGPFVEAKDMIQGFLVIKAETIDQASELAMGCPVLDFDGSVEVRPLI